MNLFFFKNNLIKIIVKSSWAEKVAWVHVVYVNLSIMDEGAFVNMNFLQIEGQFISIWSHRQVKVSSVVAVVNIETTIFKL